MRSDLIQIKKSYDELGMTPEQIADDQDLDIVAVKAALQNCSAKYRKDINKEGKEDLDFSDSQLREVNQAMYDLAMGSEDEHLRAKLLMYIRDDKKGRREPARLPQGNNFNVLVFNEQLQTARQKAEEAKRQLIDV